MKKELHNLMLFVALISLIPLGLFANENTNATNQQAAFSPSYVYSIKTQEIINNSGKRIPSKVFNMKRIDKSLYLPNTIHVKTKSIESIASNSKGFYSSTLQSTLKEFDVQSIKAPFKEFTTNDKLLKKDVYGVGRIYEVTYNSGVDPYDVCKELMKNPDIEYAVPIFIRTIDSYTVNDPKLSSQWAIKTMDAANAWDISRGSKDVLIAIVDTGVQWEHEDLSENIWTNPNEIPNNGIDDDNNGKIDDIHGWDFVGNITSTQAYNSQWKEDNDPTNLYNGHGTAVAGCAAAVTNNSLGVASTGYNCSILPVKCASDNANTGGVWRGYEAILYAAKLGADIINCSWGGTGGSASEQDIINQAAELGALIVVSSGNSYVNINDGAYLPACYDNVMTIGSTGKSDTRSDFSNWGYDVCVYAPGEEIYTTVPDNTYSNKLSGNDISGTSFSSPFTSGIAGLVKALHPEWNAKQIMHQIRSTSDNVMTTDATMRPQLYGRVNAYKAVDFNRTGRTQVPGLEVIDIELSGAEAIKDYQAHNAKFQLMNYLSASTSLKVNITPINSFYSITPSNFDIGVIGQLATKEIEAEITLLPNNPWYSGSADFLVTYTDGTFVDYQVIKIPIEISSANTYNEIYSIPASYYPVYNCISAASNNTAWICGQLYFSPYCFYYNGSSAGSANTPYEFSCIHNFDGKKISAGTVSGGAVYKTTNSGQSWTNVSVSTITDSVKFIHFFSDTEACLIGSTKNSNWGAAYTTNGGTNWIKTTYLQQPSSGEFTTNTRVTWNGNIGWFGTNKGNIFKTTNKGVNWSVANIGTTNNVHLVGFKNAYDGIAVYTTSSYPNRYLLASTSDGGSTWKTDVYNFTNLNLTPVHLFSPNDAKMIYVQCQNGEVYGTSDNGVSWTSVLTEERGVVKIADVASLGNYKARLWNVGDQIGYVDFTYPPANETKTIAVDVAEINYDTIQITKKKAKFAVVTNTGNTSLSIDSVYIVPVNAEVSEFIVTSDIPETIENSEKSTLSIRFTPAKLGLRTATLFIKTDATPNLIQVNLVGYGSETISVIDDINSNLIIHQVTPNPCSEVLNISLLSPESGIANIIITDLLGNSLISFPNFNINLGNNIVSLPVSKLSSGVYFYNIQFNNMIIKDKFIISK